METLSNRKASHICKSDTLHTYETSSQSYFGSCLRRLCPYGTPQSYTHWLYLGRHETVTYNCRPNRALTTPSRSPLEVAVWTCKTIRRADILLQLYVKSDLHRGVVVGFYLVRKRLLHITSNGILLPIQILPCSGWTCNLICEQKVSYSGERLDTTRRTSLAVLYRHKPRTRDEAWQRHL